MNGELEECKRKQCRLLHIYSAENEKTLKKVVGKKRPSQESKMASLYLGSAVLLPHIVLALILGFSYLNTPGNDNNKVV